MIKVDHVLQVNGDSGFAVRRPGECRFFVDLDCVVELDDPAFTPEIVAVCPLIGYVIINGLC